MKFLKIPETEKYNKLLAEMVSKAKTKHSEPFCLNSELFESFDL